MLLLFMLNSVIKKNYDITTAYCKIYLDSFIPFFEPKSVKKKRW